MPHREAGSKGLLGAPLPLRAVLTGLMERARSGEGVETGLRALLQELGRAIHADGCVLHLRLQRRPDAGSIAPELTWTARGSSPTMGILVPFRDNPLFEPILASGQILVLDDRADDPRLASVRDLARRLGARTAIVQPIAARGEVRGLLGAHRCVAPRAFAPADLALVRDVATHIAVITDHWFMAGRVELRERRLRLLSRVQSAVARLVDPPQIVEAAADAIHQGFETCRVIISLVERGRDELVVAAHAGGGEVPVHLRRVSLVSGEGQRVQAARTGQLVLIPDHREGPAALPIHPESRSSLHVPILSAQEIAGVLTAEAPGPHAFQEEDAATLQAVAGVLGVAIENARLFERVEQEKEEWARTFDAITDMVAIHDGDYRLLRANRALIERAMVQPYDLVGRSCVEVYSGIIGGPIDCPHAEAERRRRPVTREFETPGRGVFRLTALPCFQAGNLRYAVHLCEEITDERRLREQLLQSEKMAAVGQLVSGVAHELNNPLAGVMGYTQLMLGRATDGKLRNDLEKVFSEAQRAAKIVQNLLTFARKHKPERRYLGLSGIVEKTLELRAYELRVSNIEVQTDLQPDLPKTMLDFHQMQQVILNIVTNAEQAMLQAHGRGCLCLRSRALGDRIELRIEDDGPGIPPEHLSRIFDPFFTTKPVGKGTGLGLSICDGIVKEHGGRLRAESAPGRGAAFVVELPVVAPESAEAPPRPERAAVEASAGRAILVVDDEPSIQDLMVEILTQAGYRVDTAGSGAGALLKIGRERYDLIISDLKMPGMDGPRLFDLLRQSRPDLAAKMIFTSGETVSPETQAFLRRTGSATVLKPFSLDDLKGAVARFFRGD